MWHPDGDAGPGAVVPAFAEEGKAPEIPGPLIRVPAGTELAITIRNSVPNATLTVRGLHARTPPPAPPAPQPIDVAPDATREARFRLEVPGTYYYWGTTTGRPFSVRTREDAQLSGAIIVDEPGRAATRDRILVIGMWADTVGPGTGERDPLLFVVNGRSWPQTERFAYAVGDTVRWRVVNASADVHPMHLHGFYFRIDSRGDGNVDTVYAEARRDLVVTQRMGPGQTMLMTWLPERAGNWLFHCHVPEHFGPRGPLGARRAEAPDRGHAHARSNHALEGMSGLVVGVTVSPRKREARAAAADAARRRHLRLLARENAGGSSVAPYTSGDLSHRPTRDITPVRCSCSPGESR